MKFPLHSFTRSGFSDGVSPHLSPLSAPLAAQPPLREILQACRRHTLTLVSGMTPDTFYRQSHPDFSPVGWHLGHIAYTESLWVVEYLDNCPQIRSHYKRLFCADGLPKSQRENLPTIAEILSYLDEVRLHTLTYLEENSVPIDDTLRLWHWLIQHESQHAETIAMVLSMHRLTAKTLSFLPTQMVVDRRDLGDAEMVRVEAGSFSLGSNAPNTIDNERPPQPCSTTTFHIDRTPVTCQQYRQFIEAGGYQTAKWWSEAGWRWLQSSGVSAPLYWLEGAFEKHPVCGVSWYEAEAYTRFVGKRLPTEAEWEKAAIAGQCEQMLGNVWEWTDSWFEAYAGFQPFPYKGYSQAYFDGEHRVLRGGSWASPPPILRTSFRNWYHPHRREVFAGFRCVA